MEKKQLIHATSVVFCGRGVLIMGPSGSGKSDLALRLIDQGGMLIADDQTLLDKKDNQLFASPPESIKGLLEVRGVGVIQMPFCFDVQLHIVIECAPPSERLPEKQTMQILGVSLDKWYLSPFEASAVAKIRALLQYKIIST